MEIDYSPMVGSPCCGAGRGYRELLTNIVLVAIRLMFLSPVFETSTSLFNLIGEAELIYD